MKNPMSSLFDPDKHCPIRDGHPRCHTGCAWYDAQSESCAVLLLARRFDAVTTTEDELLVRQAGELVVGEFLETDSCSHT